MEIPNAIWRNLSRNAALQCSSADLTDGISGEGFGGALYPICSL
jgi:hypothetical protein